MNITQENGIFVPSMTYGVVRCRQLEGTYPGDPHTACWPITTLRVERGWGEIPQSAWPDTALKSWPPEEPPGLDQIAKKNRIFRYQRIRTSQECWDAVQNRHIVMASFEITREWFNAANGVIPLPEVNTPIIGSHSINIVGGDQSFTVMMGGEKRRFLFANWWGRGWGVNGHGILPWDFFNRWLIEAWTFDLVSPEGIRAEEDYFTIPGIVSPIQLVGEINDPIQDERIAWAMVTPRQDCLDVEELFVKPGYRRKGHGTKLLTSLKALSEKHQLPLRFLIPFSDCESENLAIVRKMLERIGYRIEISGVRWAPYFGIFSPGPDIKPHFPEKPKLAQPEPASREVLERRARERVGEFDSDFLKAAENVFKEHEELLRRLA